MWLCRLLFILSLWGTCSSRHFTREYTEVSVNNVAKSVDKNSCECRGYTCGCCVHAVVEKINLNDTVCVNVSYLPDEYGVSLVLLVNGKEELKEEISVRNPPPLCVALPYLKNEASICIRFRNLTIINKQLRGCVNLEARILHKLIESILLGCFKIPPGDHINMTKGITSKGKESEILQRKKLIEQLSSSLMLKNFQNGKLVNVVGLN